uniref:Uncharacterized protein n=1 Tax=Arion vulgaris TaxID=1028688 RepID=A0A0B7BBL9_9EUPU
MPRRMETREKVLASLPFAAAPTKSPLAREFCDSLALEMATNPSGQKQQRHAKTARPI